MTIENEQLMELPKSEAELLSRYGAGERSFERLILRGAELEGADLEGINLRKADLTGANLQGVNLRGAILDHVDLARANLRSADLSATSTRATSMRDVELVGATLRNANLRGALLDKASIVQTELRGALLEGARFPRARLVQVDLSGVQADADFTAAYLDMVRLGSIQRLAENTTLPHCEWGRVTFHRTLYAGRYRNDEQYWVIREEEESIFQAYAKWKSGHALSRELTIEFSAAVWAQLFPVEIALARTLGDDFEISKSADRVVVRLRDEGQLQQALDGLIPFLAGLEATSPGEVALVRANEGPMGRLDEVREADLQDLLRHVIQVVEGNRAILTDLQSTPFEELVAGAAGTVPLAGSFLQVAVREILKANRERLKEFAEAYRASLQFFAGATGLRRIETKTSRLIDVGEPAE